MPRHNRRTPPGPPPGAGERSTLGEHRDQWRGEEFVVRAVSGMAAIGPYRCPGCDQQILPGRPHTVAWSAADREAVDRRHWHTVCWSARDRRAPRLQRGHRAPRY